MSELELEKARFLWRCRRGMLELDLLLGRFMEQGFHQLDETQRALFRELLEEPDPDLYAWLMGYQVPDRADFKEFILWFRQYYCYFKA
ncbi:MAG: succinate dehydrogenase assembly factor 2 family protein [Gammaproteobacteria bacterium]|nr:succinate dehydrogenase assembly factor 2 family protein [Gammaproteobacteria bacterium]